MAKPPISTELREVQLVKRRCKRNRHLDRLNTAASALNMAISTRFLTLNTLFWFIMFLLVLVVLLLQGIAVQDCRLTRTRG